MRKNSSFAPDAVKALSPGEWIWSGGVGVRRNSDGELSWYIKYYDKSFGQRKEHIKGCRGVTDARAALAKRQTEIFEGTFRPNRSASHMRVSEFAEIFLKLIERMPVAKKYRQQLNATILPHFGSMMLSEIRRSDIVAYYNGRIAGTIGKRAVSIASANHEVNCIKSMLTAAVSEERLIRSPAAGIRLEDPKNEVKRILTPRETAHLFAAADQVGGYMLPLVSVLYYSGMRIGEACSLEWSNVDFDADTLMVGKTKNGSALWAPMHPLLREQMVLWRALCAMTCRWVFSAHGDNSSQLTIDMVKNTWSEMRKIWESRCRADGIAPGTLTRHDLRRNFASQLGSAGANFLAVKDLMNHKTMSMTQRYTTIHLGAMRDAISLMPAGSTLSAQTVDNRGWTGVQASKISAYILTLNNDS